MELIISLLIFGIVTTGTVVQSNQNGQELVEETIPVKESLFLTMERTPCFGKCPNYKITIFNTGRVIYEGIQFVEKEGKFESQLSKAQMKEITSTMNSINIFGMKDKYDSNITDIPACLLYINDGEQKKKIYDRYGGPDELRDFEKLIDKLVLNSSLIKVDKAK